MSKTISLLQPKKKRYYRFLNVRRVGYCPEKVIRDTPYKEKLAVTDNATCSYRYCSVCHTMFIVPLTSTGVSYKNCRLRFLWETWFEFQTRFKLKTFLHLAFIKKSKAIYQCQCLGMRHPSSIQTHWVDQQIPKVEAYLSCVEYLYFNYGR